MSLGRENPAYRGFRRALALAMGRLEEFDLNEENKKLRVEIGRLRSLTLAMLEYKAGRDAGKPKDEVFVRAWLETARAEMARGYFDEGSPR